MCRTLENVPRKIRQNMRALRRPVQKLPASKKSLFLHNFPQRKADLVNIAIAATKKSGEPDAT